ENGSRTSRNTSTFADLRKALEAGLEVNPRRKRPWPLELVIVNYIVLFHGPPGGWVFQCKPLAGAVGIGGDHLAVVHATLHGIRRTGQQQIHVPGLPGKWNRLLMRVVVPLRGEHDVLRFHPAGSPERHASRKFHDSAVCAS